LLLIPYHSLTFLFNKACIKQGKNIFISGKLLFAFVQLPKNRQNQNNVTIFHRSATKVKMRSQHIIDIKVLLLIFLLLPLAAVSQTNDAVHQETLRIYKATQTTTRQNDALIWENIRQLSYVQSRLLRSFCRLQKVSGFEIKQFSEELLEKTVPFETAELLDTFATLPGANSVGYKRLLLLLDGTPHSTITVLHKLIRVPALQSDGYLLIVKQASTMDASALWALKAVLEKVQQPDISIKALLQQLNQLSTSQQWLVEKVFTIIPASALSIKTIATIGTLSSTATINMMAILNNSTFDSNKALYWLDAFFRHSPMQQEEIYAGFDPLQKQKILKIYELGASELIHEINRHHDVTDRFGREISNSRLKSLSKKQLADVFERLHPKIKLRWYDTFHNAIAANNLKDINSVLHQATKQSQIETVKELTCANLYVLLSRGSQLYTSSFRNVLVPHLRAKIQNVFPRGLLQFLHTIDPTNIYTSRFISNLIRRGQLALFMPENHKQQLLILDLVEQSAFSSSESILHFSVSFDTLLARLGHQARSYFIEKIIVQLESGEKNIAAPIQLMLEDYVAGENITEQDRRTIQSVLDNRSPISTEMYTRTPFQEWLSDDHLSSLSVFQNDDDGYGSYVSNSIGLLTNGYVPHLSANFTPSPYETTQPNLIQNLLAETHKNPYRALNELFHLSCKSPIIIDWIKEVGNVVITHSTGIYQNNKNQTYLLKQFMQLGYEMYCQRGHSYWLRRQLQTPLAKIVEDDITFLKTVENKQRFLSLGACGSIESYLNLGKALAGHVDILATLGTGRTKINNMYNRTLFEIIASHPLLTSWQDVSKLTEPIFTENDEKDYLQPGSLPSLVHKMIINENYNDTH